jgi:hypothetical protein
VYFYFVWRDHRGIKALPWFSVLPLRGSQVGAGLVDTLPYYRFKAAPRHRGMKYSARDLAGIKQSSS